MTIQVLQQLQLQQWPPGNQPILGAQTLAENTASTLVPRAIQISASVAGTVTLTLVDSSTIVVNVVAGDNIYPYCVQKAVVGTATVSAYYLLF